MLNYFYFNKKCLDFKNKNVPVKKRGEHVVYMYLINKGIFAYFSFC